MICSLLTFFSCSSVGGLLYKYVYASLPRFHSYRTQIWGLNDCPTSPSADIRIRRFSTCHVLPQCSMSRLHCRFVICIFLWQSQQKEPALSWRKQFPQKRHLIWGGKRQKILQAWIKIKQAINMSPTETIRTELIRLARNNHRNFIYSSTAIKTFARDYLLMQFKSSVVSLN